MALSVEPRERVLAAHERREGSQRVLTERFDVTVGTVNGWLRQAREGRRAPLRRHGGRAALGGAGPEEPTALVSERPDATLAEYAAMLAQRAGRRFSPAVLCRALRRAGLPRKKRPCTPASGSGGELTAPVRVGLPFLERVLECRLGPLPPLPELEEGQAEFAGEQFGGLAAHQAQHHLALASDAPPLARRQGADPWRARRRGSSLAKG
jgi:transposase